jgi:hypothetical protein
MSISRGKDNNKWNNFLTNLAYVGNAPVLFTDGPDSFKIAFGYNPMVVSSVDIELYETSTMTLYATYPNQTYAMGDVLVTSVPAGTYAANLRNNFVPTSGYVGQGGPTSLSNSLTIIPPPPNTNFAVFPFTLDPEWGGNPDVYTNYPYGFIQVYNSWGANIGGVRTTMWYSSVSPQAPGFNTSFFLITAEDDEVKSPVWLSDISGAMLNVPQAAPAYHQDGFFYFALVNYGTPAGVGVYVWDPSIPTIDCPAFYPGTPSFYGFFNKEFSYKAYVIFSEYGTYSNNFIFEFNASSSPWPVTQTLQWRNDPLTSNGMYLYGSSQNTNDDNIQVINVAYDLSYNAIPFALTWNPLGNIYYVAGFKHGSGNYTSAYSSWSHYADSITIAEAYPATYIVKHNPGGIVLERSFPPSPGGGSALGNAKSWLDYSTDRLYVIGKDYFENILHLYCFNASSLSQLWMKKIYSTDSTGTVKYNTNIDSSSFTASTGNSLFIGVQVEAYNASFIQVNPHGGIWLDCTTTPTDGVYTMDFSANIDPVQAAPIYLKIETAYNTVSPSSDMVLDNPAPIFNDQSPAFTWTSGSWFGLPFGTEFMEYESKGWI